MKKLRQRIESQFTSSKPALELVPLLLRLPLLWFIHLFIHLYIILYFHIYSFAKSFHHTHVLVWYCEGYKAEYQISYIWTAFSRIHPINKYVLYCIHVYMYYMSGIRN